MSNIQIGLTHELSGGWKFIHITDGEEIIERILDACTTQINEELRLLINETIFFKYRSYI